MNHMFAKQIRHPFKYGISFEGGDIQMTFNQPLNKWNTKNVTDMSDMFDDTTSFNQPLNNWNVSNVTDMASMFESATSFDQNISKWNVSNVADYYNFSLNSPIDGTSKVPHFQ